MSIIMGIAVVIPLELAAAEWTFSAAIAIGFLGLTVGTPLAFFHDKKVKKHKHEHLHHSRCEEDRDSHKRNKQHKHTKPCKGKKHDSEKRDPHSPDAPPPIKVTDRYAREHPLSSTVYSYIFLNFDTKHQPLTGDFDKDIKSDIDPIRLDYYPLDSSTNATMAGLPPFKWTYLAEDGTGTLTWTNTDFWPSASKHGLNVTGLHLDSTGTDLQWPSERECDAGVWYPNGTVIGTDPAGTWVSGGWSANVTFGEVDFVKDQIKHGHVIVDYPENVLKHNGFIKPPSTDPCSLWSGFKKNACVMETFVQPDIGHQLRMSFPRLA